MSTETISSLNIRDEFALVRNDAVFADVARVLTPRNVNIVLVRGNKNKGVIGVIPHTHFLEICSKKINPANTLAKDHLLTNILRLKEETPLVEAAKIIHERKPDAVLVLSGENKFSGYLSPNDIREMTDKLSASGDEPEVDLDGVISTELDLTDEFDLIPYNSALCDVAAKLYRASTKVVLIRGKKGKGIVGSISETRFLEVCATGINPINELARKHMQTDLLRLKSNTPLKEAIKIVEEKDPDAVLVLGPKNRFVGYLSPSDHRRAVELLSQMGKEEYDIEEIKPVIPPIPPGIGDLNQSSDELPISDLIERLKFGLGSGDAGPVVWQEDGSSILIHNESVRAHTDSPNLLVELDVDCDQTGNQTISFKFNIGSGSPRNLDASSEVVPEGSKLIVGRWGVIMQEIIWHIITETMDKHTPSQDIAVGFSAGDSVIRLKTAPVNPHLRVAGNPMIEGVAE